MDLIAALHGDWALNLYNSAALAFWKEQGLSSACVSFELRDAQIRDLSKCLPCEAIVYGRLPLMLTENCLNANAFGCRYFTERPASVPCDGACASAPELTDRRGEHFPVLRAWGCRSEIENGKILYLADKARDWQSAWPALCLPALHDGIARGLRAHAARVSGRDGRSAGEYHPWSLLSRRRMNSKL